MTSSRRAATLAAILGLGCLWPAPAAAQVVAEDPTPAEEVSRALADNLRERIALEPLPAVTVSIREPLAAPGHEPGAEWLSASRPDAQIAGRPPFQTCNRRCKNVILVVFVVWVAVAGIIALSGGMR